MDKPIKGSLEIINNFLETDKAKQLSQTERHSLDLLLVYVNEVLEKKEAAEKEEPENNYEFIKRCSMEQMALMFAINEDPNSYPNLCEDYIEWLKDDKLAKDKEFWEKMANKYCNKYNKDIEVLKLGDNENLAGVDWRRDLYPQECNRPVWNINVEKVYHICDPKSNDPESGEFVVLQAGDSQWAICHPIELIMGREEEIPLGSAINFDSALEALKSHYPNKTITEIYSRIKE